MTFEGLSEKLQGVLKNIRGVGRVTDKDVKEMMREIKLVLLEADVNFKVVKNFIAKISERAVGQEVLESLTPGQQIIKIVNEELTEILGGTQSRITFSSKPPTVIMMSGLQGSGKTTTAGKLANILRKQGKKPLLTACDIYRPAAVKQLQVLGGQLDIPVFSIEGGKPVIIAKSSIEYANEHGHDLVIIDTAGRLHIDEEMMQELREIKKEVRPHEILLVIDAMTGQDAVNVARNFDEKLGIDGIVLTKLDGDTRGGAVLSVKAITGKPVKYSATGEKLNDIEPFYPDRMASRILGMGDVLSFIEKAQEVVDEKKAIEMEKKIRTQQFTLGDFLDQMQQIKNMGPISKIMDMIPGLNKKRLGDVEVNEKDMLHVEAIIRAMTQKERESPEIINASRKKRIASGSGTTVQDVNKLLKRFGEMKKMFKQMSEMAKGPKGIMGR